MHGIPKEGVLKFDLVNLDFIDGNKGFYWSIERWFRASKHKNG